MPCRPGPGPAPGPGFPLVVAAATLAVAALFQPARRRIQQAVDRRFNRRRHDAAQTIAAFSDRPHQQIDLDSLSAELLGVVDQTMQPTQASLWLRPSQPAPAQPAAHSAPVIIQTRPYSRLKQVSAQATSSCSAVMRDFDHGDRERARAGDVQRG